MSPTEFNDYFPYVDNIYKLKKRNSSPRSNTITTYYECRFYGNATHTEKRQEVDSAGENAQVHKHRRHKSRRDANQCDIKMKVVHHSDDSGQAISYTIYRISGTQHLHPLDRSDQIKRNSKVRDALRQEAEKLYAPSTILKVASNERSLNGREVLQQIGGSRVRPKERFQTFS
ncbi:hypothetical protein V1525DRAFT_421813 [Lipomyces kononenkoae]|uniref:Uncharacterized protein n=1 Tax=Lipomyces kononenkoae TaxID=34357 RepID=A0ACC3SUU4_LIPKO